MTSVVIPVFNGLHTLPTTARAVTAMEEVGELVWVDDGSTDGTSEWLDAEVADVPGARVLHLGRNRGRAEARNAGARATTGEALVFMDADVEPTPRSAARLAEAAWLSGAVASVARFDLVVTDPDEPYADYAANHPRGPGQEIEAGGVVDWRFFLSGACAVRRSAFERAGGFDTSIQYGEDLALGCDLRRLHPDGLRLAGTTVRLHDIGDLDAALAHAESLGRSLHAVRSKCPDLGTVGLKMAGLADMTYPLLKHMIRRLPRGRGRRRAVRYLIGATVLRASRRA